MDDASPRRFTACRFRTGDGLELAYRDYRGPRDAPFTVICLPGLTRNVRDFEDLAPRLAARWRVLCLDTRGRGESARATDPMTYVPKSYVADLGALIAHEGLSEVALIGTSLGGMVATLFTAIHPEKVLGVVLNDVGPEIDPRGLARIAGYVGKTPPIETWEDAADAVADIDSGNFPDYGPADWLRQAKRRYAEGPDGRPRLDYDLDIAKAFATPAATPEQWPFFHRLSNVPALLLRGATSDVLARETVERMKAAAPGLTAVEIEGRGHTPALDEPQALAAIEGFLASLPSGFTAIEKAARAKAGKSFQPTARDLGVL
jgi:pimeloyl-ACP methyl ester carboxylesterase